MQDLASKIRRFGASLVLFLMIKTSNPSFAEGPGTEALKYSCSRYQLVSASGPNTLGSSIVPGLVDRQLLNCRVPAGKRRSTLSHVDYAVLLAGQRG